MRPLAASVLALTLAAALAACDEAPDPVVPGDSASEAPEAAAIHLPSGDVTRGLAAFEKLRCTDCHQVVGCDFPAQEHTLRPPHILGERVTSVPTDGYFLTAIVAPSHELAPSFDRSRIDTGGESIMGDYSYVMTVRQLLDLVAFLRSAYASAVQR